jgi:SAM-dependent methyltransferase
VSQGILAAAAALSLAVSTCAGARKPDVPFEPTPAAVVDAMLQLAEVRPGDVVYDLGCGDGRIVVRAAQLGARGVGIDVDPARIAESRARARADQVEDRVVFREGDLFEADVTPATVVTLFLWPEVNLRLRPRLLAQLQPGARIVSYMHDMGDWAPRRTITVAGGHRVFLWVVPARASSSEPGAARTPRPAGP